jgi:hypothetical protein
LNRYVLANRPVVITDVIGEWPACARWDREYLRQAYGDSKAIVGGYVDNIQPLIMFI